jgi:leader peptidase (prepilin peptidase)/N-methyltransferase
MIETFILLVGLCIASFIGSLSYRVPRGISIVKPRSYCPHCKKNLGIQDLIPVVSYLMLKGRCRYCGARIPIQYLFIEILTPLFYFILYRKVGIGQTFFLYSYLFTAMLYLSLLDIDTGRIGPWDIASVYAGDIALVWLLLSKRAIHAPSYHLFGLLVGAGLVAVSFGCILVLKRKIPMGTGDLMVIPAISFYFGTREIIRVLVFGSALGILFSAVLIMAGVVKREHKFPMIPYLTAGIMIEVLIF